MPSLGELPPHLLVPPPGPESRAWSMRLARVESPAFEARREARAQVAEADQGSIVYERAQGINVQDVDGNVYVDLIAGFGACVLGHNPAPVVQAHHEASQSLTLALGDVYASKVKVELCEALAALYPEPGARVLLGLSGADAVTAALKTAVLATGKPGIVAFEGAYHGLSYAPLAACGLAPSFRQPFAAQLGDHVRFCPYPGSASELDASLAAVRAALSKGDVGALLVEPVLGRGGCVVPPAGFLRALRALCTEHGALLVADEIWCGMGRAGALIASLQEATPDVVCLAKGLGAGFPISACIGSERVMEAWGAHGGSVIHTATHFAAPGACAAALASLRLLREQQLPERAVRVGDLLQDELRAQFEGTGVLVRGRGMMIGCVFPSAKEALAVARGMLLRGYLVLTGGARGNVLTLSPALTIPEGLAQGFARALGDQVRGAPVL
jgi:4-aminobutyrate aminotransferase / (S)-3-amino-2-methylpropionate transaminase / 5-aminovalerate transaminase